MPDLAPLSFHSPHAASAHAGTRTLMRFSTGHGLSTDEIVQKVASAVGEAAFTRGGVDSFDVVPLGMKDSKLMVAVELLGSSVDVWNARTDFESALSAEKNLGFDTRPVESSVGDRTVESALGG